MAQAHETLAEADQLLASRTGDDTPRPDAGWPENWHRICFDL